MACFALAWRLGGALRVCWNRDTLLERNILLDKLEVVESTGSGFRRTQN